MLVFHHLAPATASGPVFVIRLFVSYRTHTRLPSYIISAALLYDTMMDTIHSKAQPLLILLMLPYEMLMMCAYIPSVAQHTRHLIVIEAFERKNEQKKINETTTIVIFLHKQTLTQNNNHIHNDLSNRPSIFSILAMISITCTLHRFRFSFFAFLEISLSNLKIFLISKFY